MGFKVLSAMINQSTAELFKNLRRVIGSQDDLWKQFDCGFLDPGRARPTVKHG